ncbi:subtype B tannase [Streptomyces griseorubiginosus]|uniref:subtype B tannase n=1 Tax=Streptomyces griseorubiginosus TaxID=67304 RepID=UPI002E80847A|nr:subtype B tannase [Streptomyces griseorubiginosus]WUB50045.1 alpha/beta hydrolase [Streptomyces griseorubiginosus]WUB58575.1 alpha/beta hydrolase [Streptomyces griseorubiginosus]
MGIGATAGAAAVGGIALTANAATDTSATSTDLVFDPDACTKLTTTVTDTEGTEHAVTYHFWKAITYVSKPVDATYQSLIVSAPVEIDGTAVDASNAPILLANSVGGYMPSSVADATGVGAGGMGGGAPGGGAPSGAPTGSAAPTAAASAAPGANGNTNANGGATSSNQLLALAAGYVVIEPGARGRTLKNASGEYYGTAPAAIVDLKAAVRYIKANKGRIPGDVERIVSAGTSAGGALSALLGASGDSPLYDRLLEEIGAADASDAIFAAGAWCPITDLEHADGAYEWNWGGNALSTGKQVDQTVSKELRAQFAEYQASLKLRGLNGFGTLTARNYDAYLVKQYLEPSATRYLAALPDADREAYLAENTFITWKNGKAGFTWAGFLSHVGARKKNTPAFDAFDLSAGENNLFGAGTTANRHFTAYSAKNDTTGLSTRRVASDLPAKLDQMNPMHHLVEKVNGSRSRHWWIRLGTNDTDTSHVVSANLAAAAARLGDDVNHLYYWDQGHGANTDPGDFIAWIAKVTGYKRAEKAAKTK